MLKRLIVKLFIIVLISFGVAIFKVDSAAAAPCTTNPVPLDSVVANVPNKDGFYPDFPYVASPISNEFYYCIQNFYNNPANYGIKVYAPFFLNPVNLTINRSDASPTTPMQLIQTEVFHSPFPNNPFVTQVVTTVFNYTNPTINGVPVGTYPTGGTVNMPAIDVGHSRWRPLDVSLNEAQMPFVDGNYDLCFNVTAVFFYNNGGGIANSSGALCTGITITSNKTTVSGRVYNTASGAGISGVNVAYCKPDGTMASVTTAADGTYNFLVPALSSYCVRIGTDPPGSWTPASPQTFGMPAQPTAKSYEFQTAGVNAGGAWDRNTDANTDFAYTPNVTYYPWLQVKNGDVLALNSIVGQIIGKDSSRQSGATEKEATYVIMAALNNVDLKTQTAVSNFCSSNSQNFGIRDGSDGIDDSCSSGAYVPNIDREFFYPKSYTPIASGGGGPYEDMIINNFWRGFDDSKFSSKPGNCMNNPAKPYFIFGNGAAAGVIGANLRSDMSSRSPIQKCPTAWRSASGNISNGAPIVISKGRASVFYGDDLSIDTNIIYSYPATGFTNINDVPNLGIIVNGDVYISSNVTQIDAAIYATGVIHTCKDYDLGTFANCRNNSLTINGALLAKGGIKFGRAKYSNTPGSPPAELIQTNGQFLAYPPPGFENRYGYNVNKLQFIGSESGVNLTTP